MIKVRQKHYYTIGNGESIYVFFITKNVPKDIIYLVYREKTDEMLIVHMYVCTLYMPCTKMKMYVTIYRNAVIMKNISIKQIKITFPEAGTRD